MEQTILERLVSYVYVCLERFRGFPKLTPLLVTFNRYFLLSPGFIRDVDTIDNSYIPKEKTTTTTETKAPT